MDKPAKKWTPSEKLRVVVEGGRLSDDKLGEFLRREGLHEAQVREWRTSAEAAFVDAGRSTRPSTEGKRIKELERELLRKDRALAEAAALLILQKKRGGHLGGRGRRHGEQERAMIIEFVNDAVTAGSTREHACETVGLSARTVERWRGGKVDDERHGPKTAPANKLSASERQAVLDVVNEPRFRDLSPSQIVPLLADESRFLGSESTVYRILRDEDLLQHRGRANAPRSHVAVGPNQVWSWDITYLKSTTRGAFFYLYMIIDVWSRKAVGWAVHEVESASLAATLFEETCVGMRLDARGIVLHADNGGPMKGSMMVATLERLGVLASFSRPHVSDDNPYSEALFRTLKYRPNYPTKPFADVVAAQEWVRGFVRWYNGVHLHSGISFVTPDDRHAGKDTAILAKRHAVYELAKAKNPERWTKSTRDWTALNEVYLNPETREVTTTAGAAKPRNSNSPSPLPPSPSPSPSKNARSA
jgi:transposase InsO family protein